MPNLISSIKKIALLCLTMWALGPVYAQPIKPASLEGVVMGQGEPLVWVTVRLGNLGPGVVTNTEGEFRLIIPMQYQDSLIQFSTIGYKPLRLSIIDAAQFKGRFTLSEEVFQTQEILVTPKNSGFGMLQDGKWQSAFYREYFVKEMPDNPNGKPVEMLECDYWMQRVARKDLADKVLITNSRARANFDKVNLSSSYCLTATWLLANDKLKYYYDSLIIKKPLATKGLFYNGQKAVETIFDFQNKYHKGHYTVITQAQTGDVVQIVVKSSMKLGTPNNVIKYFSAFRFWKGFIQYTLNYLNDDITIRYNNLVPEFLWHNVRFYNKFDDPSFGQDGTYNLTSMWTRTGETDAEPTSYSFKWKPGEALFRQAISKGEKFWELNNTILPNKREEEYLKILSAE